MDLVNKYRPTRLGQVIGQDAAVATLRGVIKAREEINPVTLFCGPHSTGKTTLAWLLALYSNCKELTEEGEACRKCSSCRSIIQAIRTGAEANSVIEKPVSNRGIDAVREIEAQAQYRSQHRYRWYILDEVHNLTKPAFDAALRLFEKPPKQTRFILCTTAPHAIPRTILSRNFIFHLKPIQPKVTAKKLLLPICKKEGYEISNKILLKCAEAVGGYPRDALNLLSQIVAAGEGGIDPDDLPRLIEASEAAAPYIAIQKFVSAVLKGNYGAALYATKKATSAEYFISQVIAELQQVIYHVLQPDKLANPDHRLNIDIKSLEKKMIPDLCSLLEIACDVQHRIKQYTVDSGALLDVATMRMVTLAKTSSLA